MAVQLLLLLPAASAAPALTSILPIGVEGDSDPDGGPLTLDFFGTPVLNDAGQAAFVASIGSSVHEPMVLRGSLGTIPSVIARGGDAPPDGIGRLDTFGSRVQINNSGQVLFGSDMVDATTGDPESSGLFVGDGADMTQAYRSNRPAPGGGMFDGLANSPTFGENGETAFHDIYDAPAGINGRAAFRTPTTGGPIVVARRGDPSTVVVPKPGQPGEFELAALRSPGVNGDIVIDPAGRSVFLSGLQNSSGNYLGAALYHRDAGGGPLTEVFIGGDGLVGGGTYQPGSLSGVNAAGQVLSSGQVSGLSGGGSPRAIVLSEAEAGSRLVARAGIMPPGSGGLAIQNLGAGGLNDAGQVAFDVFLNGITDTGVYLHDGAGLKKIAVTGDGLPGGVGKFGFIGGSMINDRGQVLFNASLDGVPGQPIGTGVFLYDPLLGVVKVVQSGDTLLGNTITQPELNFAPDGHSRQGLFGSGLNNRGQVAFKFDLADNRSGVALFTLPTAITITGGTFDGGLGPYVADGDVAITASPISGDDDPAARLTTASPVSISRLIDTPDLPFLLTYDAFFEQADGVLEVALGGTIIDTLTAELTPGFTDHTVLVEDPSLLGGSFLLEFTFDAATAGQVVYLDNIGSVDAIPEPGTLALLGLGGLCLLGRRRRGA